MDYSIKIDEFEGPLDLLLHLINSANINIYDISIEEITRQYMDYINKMEELNINVASSYLVMAAELMEIKSKSLLPKKEIQENLSDSEEEISRDNLIKKLIEYQKYKEITKDFKNLESDRRELYTKAPSRISNIVDSKIVNDSDITCDDLLYAFQEFLKRKDMEKPINTKIANREYSVRKRKDSVKNYLRTKGKSEFSELLDSYDKAYIIVSFLSILELTREDEIIITQDKSFDKIYLELKVK